MMRCMFDKQNLGFSEGTICIVNRIRFANNRGELLEIEHEESSLVDGEIKNWITHIGWISDSPKHFFETLEKIVITWGTQEDINSFYDIQGNSFATYTGEYTETLVKFTPKELKSFYLAHLNSSKRHTEITLDISTETLLGLLGVT